ncbi:hypothetical protein SAMN02746009_03520 [Hymenobacter psychrotolerans DSM 18569]|uniref:Uncharacterized protein n=2 Tax=Hymenobacter psychrotolerans TaxID=344998 RepID=A0A1M7E577_9BACT|nr:hypothetical protein SAMN02746009_03520 [Hymenobacter psychrotolerans DSM 18569]
MTADALLSHLTTLGQTLADATDTGDAGSDSPLEQARVFLFTYLPQEPHVPYRADDLLELLAPSPHTHRSWAEERLLLLEGLSLLQQLWEKQRQPATAAPAAPVPEPVAARRRAGMRAARPPE